MDIVDAEGEDRGTERDERKAARDIARIEMEGSRELHGYQTFRVNRIGCRLP
jgi:hypothetical protein